MNNLSTFLVRLLTVTATWSTSQQKSVSKLNALFFHTSAAAYCTHFSLLKNVTCNSKPMDNIDKQNSTNKNWGIHTIFWHSNILVDSLIFYLVLMFGVFFCQSLSLGNVFVVVAKQWYGRITGLTRFSLEWKLGKIILKYLCM